MLAHDVVRIVRILVVVCSRIVSYLPCSLVGGMGERTERNVPSAIEGIVEVIVLGSFITTKVVEVVVSLACSPQVLDTRIVRVDPSQDVEVGVVAS